MSKRKQSFSLNPDKPKDSQETKIDENLETEIRKKIKIEEDSQEQEEQNHQYQSDNINQENQEEHKQSYQQEIKQEQQMLKPLQNINQSQKVKDIQFNKNFVYLIVQKFLCYFNKQLDARGKFNEFRSLYDYLNYKFDQLLSLYMDKDEEIFYDIIKSKKNLENENIKKAIDQFNIEFETAIKQQYSQIQSLTIDGIQFDSELFEKISKQIISQCPFHSLEQNDWQYTEKIQKFEKSKGASEWFIQLVDKNLVHFANFVVFKKTDEQFINNNKIDVIYFNKDIIIPPTNQNNEYYYQYITRTDFSLEQQKQQIGDLNSRQISLYFHKENLENLINAHQKLLGKNLQLQFIFYFNMALLRKLFINYDFYGVPLTEKEFVIKDFSKSMKKIFLLYTESWSCYLKKQPYIENIKINREEYKISQNFYLSEIQFQLNLENYE